MKILFVGCVKSSKFFLQKLISMNENIVGVVTKQKSNFNSDFCDLSILCDENLIEYKYVKNINDKDSIDFIKRKNPDVIYCFGWSQIIGKEILSMPEIGVLGFHPSNLPKNRGRHPIIWALALGLEETASTFFFIDQGADTGDIISQEIINIDYQDDANSLYNKILDKAILQLEEFNQQLKEGIYKRIKQDNCLSNSWRKRGKDDGKIDWRMSSRSIYNLVRSLAKPYVGAHFIYEGKEIKVWKVQEMIDDCYINIEPGKIVKVLLPRGFVVKTGENLIKVIDYDDASIKEGDYL
ncbi:formyltransferase family protein [Wukongibacter baidiensis]|uniref:formyltransferase family protein n=1 Tax=Wukongibacter baidiensis TaxID=1723361 RepID=UPI003D7FAFDE